MQQTNSFKGIVMLLLCSFIWGTAFVAQSVGADLLGPFSFNGIRSFLGAFFLVPCIAVIDRLSGKPLSFWGTDDSHKRGDLITGGLCCGVLFNHCQHVAANRHRLHIRRQSRVYNGAVHCYNPYFRAACKKTCNFYAVGSRCRCRCRYVLHLH